MNQQLPESALPSISALRARTKALALLDAILCREWQYRYHSFNSAWASGEEMASMRDGCGDNWFLLFTSEGAALKGFAHELSEVSVANAIQTSVPSVFASFLREPAFSMRDATFCYWRSASDMKWHRVAPTSMGADGSMEMLALLVGGPVDYVEWANGYYELSITLASVESIFSGEFLTTGLINSLNPEADLTILSGDLEEIGYSHTLGMT